MGEWKQTACNFCGVRCGFEMLVENNITEQIIRSRTAAERAVPPDIFRIIPEDSTIR